MQKSKLSKLTERVYNFNFTELAYEFDKNPFRYRCCIVLGATILLCKISLQFCCDFIDNNRSNICVVSDIAKLMKLPMSTLLVLHSGLKLAGYKSQDDKNEPKNQYRL